MINLIEVKDKKGNRMSRQYMNDKQLEDLKDRNFRSGLDLSIKVIKKFEE